jgi:hypothetical protein
MDEELYHYLVTEYSYQLGSPYVLYDEDMRNIILRAKKMSNSGLVTKAQLIRAFRQYCREYRLSIKIETFLRKLRQYARKKRYIAYTYKRGLYKVLI